MEYWRARERVDVEIRRCEDVKMRIGGRHG